MRHHFRTTYPPDGGSMKFPRLPVNCSGSSLPYFAGVIVVVVVVVDVELGGALG